MNLFDVLRPECVAARQTLPTKEAVLAEAARLARASALTAPVPEQAILDGLKAREALGSTGIGKGIAIPHCKIGGLQEFVVGLITLAEGVPFEALDEQPVRIVIFILAPEDQSNAHIRILSKISQVFSLAGADAELLGEDHPEALREGFLRHVRDEAPVAATDQWNMFHVMVQDKDLFHDVLQVFESMETASVTIVNAECAGAYLSRMPLFAGLWSDQQSSYCQIIVAVVSRPMSNETIRRIDQHAGGLEGSNRVMVCVTNLSYSSGRIET